MCMGAFGAGKRSERVVGSDAGLNGIAGLDSTVAIYLKTLHISVIGVVASGMNFLIWMYETSAKILMHRRVL